MVINANPIEKTQNRDINSSIKDINSINKAKRMNYINKIQKDPKKENYSNKVANNPKGERKEVFCENSSSFLCVLDSQKRNIKYINVYKNSLKENKKYVIEDKDKYA